MIFKKLKIKNIRSYENLELEFPRGSVLLSGDIGAGKTSILLALQFALFGLQPGQKGASLLRQGTDNAYVSLELEIDNQTIILERTIKKSKNNSITQELNVLTIDGKSQKLSASEMKNKVISLLNYPKEFIKKSNLLYKFTVYTPQEQMKAIIQEKPEVRLDTLRHIFGIDRYKRIKDNLQIFLQKIKETIKIKEAETKEINLLKEKLNLEREDYIKIKKQINDLKIEHAKILEQKQKQEIELKNIQELIEQKQKILSELSNKETALLGKKEIKNRLEKETISMQNQIKQKIDFSDARLQEVSNLLQKHKNILDKLNKDFLELNSQISVLNSNKESAIKLKEKILSMENCPTCFQPVAPEHKARISKKTQYDIEEIDRELEKKILQKNQLIKEIEREKEIIAGYEQDKVNLEADKIKFEHQKDIETKIKSNLFVLERVIKEIKDLENQISELRTNSQDASEIKKQFEEQKILFEEILTKLKDIEISLAEKNKEVEILKKHLEELVEEIKKQERIRDQINYLKELQDWLQEKFLVLISTIETNVLAKLRNEFSKIFNEWFSILVSDSLSVRLDEDFTPIIFNQDYEIEYEFLSGGERTAVALAYRLALNQILNSILSKIKTKDILILDEPTDGFSAEQLDKMRDIFEQLKSEQIILVSHEQKIEGFVDNIIRIKKDGTSFVESKLSSSLS